MQDEVDRFPSRQVDGDYRGPATIEAYTVMHGAEGPEVALVTALTPGGQRVLATNRDAATMASFMADEPIGRAAEIAPDGTLAVCTRPRRPAGPEGGSGGTSPRLAMSSLRGRPVP